jgi:hypothetical protein
MLNSFNPGIAGRAGAAARRSRQRELRRSALLRGPSDAASLTLVWNEGLSLIAPASRWKALQRFTGLTPGRTG